MKSSSAAVKSLSRLILTLNLCFSIQNKSIHLSQTLHLVLKESSNSRSYSTRRFSFLFSNLKCCSVQSSWKHHYSKKKLSKLLWKCHKRWEFLLPSQSPSIHWDCKKSTIRMQRTFYTRCDISLESETLPLTYIASKGEVSHTLPNLSS